MTVLNRPAILDSIRGELHAINEEIPLDLPADLLLREELGVDSLDLVELVASLEYRFGFVVPQEDWLAMVTLDHIADYVVNRGSDG